MSLHPMPTVAECIEFSLEQWSDSRLDHIEQALDLWVHAGVSHGSQHAAPAELVQAMRYAVLDGGKRLRPLLVLAASEAVAGTNGSVNGSVNGSAALRAACAVELIHAYSLVHDDMPCMDNDVLRRGKPTVHVRFGEATALLAGDALQALAFELLTPLDGSIAPTIQARLCGLLARAAGSAGMAGGQAIDLASVGKSLNEQQMREMHELKTGALLRGSVLMGAACGEPDGRAWGALRTYGDAVGLAFQVVDDILDVTGDSATLGKTAGKDALHLKPTYVSLLGLGPSRALAQSLLTRAQDALNASGLPSNAQQPLLALAHSLVYRVC